MIGVSLPLTYLVDSPGVSPAALAWQSALGDAGSALVALREAGVASVELRSISQGTDPQAVLCGALRVRNAGLGLTIHGHLPWPIRGETFAELYPSLAPLATAPWQWGPESVMTVHCCMAAGATAEELAGATVQALRCVIDVLEREQIPLRIALENEGLRARPNPAVTYEGILAIIGRAASPRLGACWDFGHAYANVQEGRLERVPPVGFLSQVIHTHIHDLGPKTHCPLSCGVVPLELYLDLLLDAGYAGLLNLELSADRFQEGRGGDPVHASIERLAQHLRRRSLAGGGTRQDGP